MKINLVNLPSPDLAEPWTNFPLGLGYLAASIEVRGYDVSIWDLCSNPKNFGKIPGADIYGISLTTPQYDNAITLAKDIRAARPKALIVAGGPHAQVDCASLLSHGNFDAVVRGEGEQAFYELVRCYELFGKVKNIYEAKAESNLDNIPFPARHLFADFKKNTRRTHSLLKDDYVHGGQTTIIASRGCPYQCSFCSPHPRRLRFRSVPNVIAELKQLIERYGIRQFKWQDDTFTINRKWTLDLCNAMKSLPVRTYHRAHTRVNVFDEKMAIAMQAAGFRLLCFGIESFSQRILDNNLKYITVEQIERALAVAKQYSFKTLAYLIFGLPGENPKSIEETKAGILRNKKNLDYIVLSNMVPYLGTPVWENPDHFNCEILEYDWSKFWLFGGETKDSVLVKTKGVKLQTMQHLKRNFYDFIREHGYARPEWKN